MQRTALLLFILSRWALLVPLSGHMQAQEAHVLPPAMPSASGAGAAPLPQINFSNLEALGIESKRKNTSRNGGKTFVEFHLPAERVEECIRGEEARNGVKFVQNRVRKPDGCPSRLW